MRHNRQELYFFIILATISFVVAIVFLAPYLAALSVAGLVAILFYPMYEHLLKWCKGRAWAAMFLSACGILLTFVIPFAAAGVIAFQVISNFVGKLETKNLASTISVPWIVVHVNRLLRHFPHVTFRLTTGYLNTELQQAASWLGSHWLGSLQNFGTALLTLVPATIMAIYVVAAIFRNYDKIGDFLHRLSPLTDDIDRLYITRIKAMGLSMVRGTFVIALVQGLVVGVVLWICGLQYAAFFGLLTVIASVIPMGAAGIMLPIGLFLLLTGQIWQGVVVILSLMLIVSNIDSLLRPRLVSKTASLPPALTIIGLFAGLANFGFMGVIYGPVLMIFFVTTIEVYMKYFRPGAGPAEEPILV